MTVWSDISFWNNHWITFVVWVKLLYLLRSLFITKFTSYMSSRRMVLYRTLASKATQVKNCEPWVFTVNEPVKHYVINQEMCISLLTKLSNLSVRLINVIRLLIENSMFNKLINYNNSKFTNLDPHHPWRKGATYRGSFNTW